MEPDPAKPIHAVLSNAIGSIGIRLLVGGKLLGGGWLGAGPKPQPHNPSLERIGDACPWPLQNAAATAAALKQTNTPHPYTHHTDTQAGSHTRTRQRKDAVGRPLPPQDAGDAGLP